jgi:hypothetical protein
MTTATVSPVVQQSGPTASPATMTVTPTETVTPAPVTPTATPESRVHSSSPTVVTLSAVPLRLNSDFQVRDQYENRFLH